MSTPRPGRSRLVRLVALLLCIGAAVLWWNHRDTGTTRARDDSAMVTSMPTDLASACAKNAVAGPLHHFYAAHPVVLAHASGRHWSVVALRAANRKAYAVCTVQLLGGFLDEDTDLYPVPVAPKGPGWTPWTAHHFSGKHQSVGNVTLTNQLPSRAVRAVAWLVDGQKIQLRPQRERFIAASVELRSHREAKDPVQRFRYMDAAGHVLGEWVAPGVRHNPTVPVLRSLSFFG